MLAPSCQFGPSFGSAAHSGSSDQLVEEVLAEVVVEAANELADELFQLDHLVPAAVGRSHRRRAGATPVSIGSKHGRGARHAPMVVQVATHRGDMCGGGDGHEGRGVAL